jgi:hypothetical protein
MLSPNVCVGSPNLTGVQPLRDHQSRTLLNEIRDFIETEQSWLSLHLSALCHVRIQKEDREPRGGSSLDIGSSSTYVLTIPASKL